MTRIKLLIVFCLAIVGFVGCAPRAQAPAWLDLRRAGEEPPRPIDKSPRYDSYYQDEFILTIFNTLAHRVVVNMVGEESIIIEPGQRADIPFKKGPDCRVVILTANVFIKGELIGTAKREQCVPDLGDRSRTADIWLISRYCRLKH